MLVIYRLTETELDVVKESTKPMSLLQRYITVFLHDAVICKESNKSIVLIVSVINKTMQIVRYYYSL